jgi:hypothetical protein
VDKNYKELMAQTAQSVATLKDADFNRISELEKTYKPFKKINDPRFGDINIVKNFQTNDFLVVKEKKINDRTEAGR